MSTSVKKSVMVGLSGGVDSAVAAYLLQQKGYDVHAVFMQNWDNNDPQCSAHEDLSSAKQVSDHLQCPLTTVNFSQDYWDRVFQHFLDEYTAGRTPNPDVLCNQEIKFKAFLEHALKAGIDTIATGHYAQIQTHNNHSLLLQGTDPNKDQSYFLCMLNQKQLSHSLMPLGAYTKPEIRNLAKKIGLHNWDRKDSTGICFIGERKFKDFLKNYVLAQPGKILSDTGDTIGTHNGLMFYTLGQRQGLQIGGIKDAPESAWYVIAKNIENNTLTVGQGNDHPGLYSQQLCTPHIHWIGQSPEQWPYPCMARIRHRQTLQKCHIKRNSEGSFSIQFEQPQRAITPGQVIALYQDDVCLGGAIIH